jgi:hypothetical protein
MRRTDVTIASYGKQATGPDQVQPAIIAGSMMATD